MKLLNTSGASCSDASVTFSRSKHTPWLPRLIPLENLPHGEPRKGRLDFSERESGDWHDAVCWQTKSSLKWESNTQRCQFSCRTLDQPDYWLQQIKVIPKYQRRVHAGWPCHTPARRRQCLQGGNEGLCLHLALYVWAAVCGSCGRGQKRCTLGFYNQGSGITFSPCHQSDLS